MLSKIENGMTSPSLTTLQSLSRALGVPVTAFFRRYEERRGAVFVKAGEGLSIERRGTRNGHQYHLLGHTGERTSRVVVEPYLITLTEESDVFPLFQHSGLEFLYMLEGEVVYRHADRLYTMLPGDSLFFDADAPARPGRDAQAARSASCRSSPTPGSRNDRRAATAEFGIDASIGAPAGALGHDIEPMRVPGDRDARPHDRAARRIKAARRSARALNRREPRPGHQRSRSRST